MTEKGKQPNVFYNASLLDTKISQVQKEKKKLYTPININILAKILEHTLARSNATVHKNVMTNVN
jgi:hypothetical protein